MDEELEEKLEEQSQEIIDGLITRLGQWKTLRMIVAAVVIGLLLGFTCHFALKLIPRKYRLMISGGEILFYHHFLATLVRKELSEEGVNVVIQPTSGSFEALRLVSEGKLDMAFIQGGLDKQYPNVLHGATLQPEALHFLVKPGINEVSDLRGKVINLGSPNGGVGVIAKRVLEFTGLTAEVDYVEMNRTSEKIVNMHPARLPDVVAVVSCVPSYLADFFVKERGYRLLEIPFPTSLAYRFGWVAEISIPDYTYNVQPPVPDKEIKTVGVNMQLVVNQNAPMEAVQKVLEAIYGPTIESKTRYKLDENEITAGACYPISKATLDFINRNDPIFSMEKFEELSNTFGLLMTLFSGFVLFMKWAMGEDQGEEDEDEDEGACKKKEKEEMDSESDSEESGDAESPEETIVRPGSLRSPVSRTIRRERTRKRCRPM